MMKGLKRSRRIKDLGVYLSLRSNPREKIWTEPEELVARRISGRSDDGPNDREKIIDAYVPLRKLYD